MYIQVKYWFFFRVLEIVLKGLIMDFDYNFQDVVCCYYCEILFFFLYCDFCYKNICNDFEVKYVLELLKFYEIVLFKECGFIFIC